MIHGVETGSLDSVDRWALTKFGLIRKEDKYKCGHLPKAANFRECQVQVYVPIWGSAHLRPLIGEFRNDW